MVANRKTPKCEAEWYRLFTYTGMFSVRRFKTANVFCGLDAGHDGKHKAWVGGYPRTGLLEW